MEKNLKGAVLIHGGNAKSRETKTQEILNESGINTSKNNPDIKILKNAKNKKSIGINKVRDSIKFLSQKPYMSNKKFVIIKNAHLLTRQAQNALLKTLEEAPEYATIILQTQSKNELLETVLSRCQQLKIKPKTKKATQKGLSRIKKLSNAQKLEFAEKLSKKSQTELTTLLEEWIQTEREQLKTTPKGKNKKELFKQTQKNLKTLELVRKDLNTTNVNTQLALEFLLLKLS